MAELVQGGGEPVNNGEIRVLKALKEQLAGEVRIVPNWTVVHKESLDECDAIVVTRDAVFIVETKSLAGKVEIGENDFYVDGSKRTHPYHLTHYKAQRLRTKLNNALPWFGQAGRVEAQVILAIQPRSIWIDDLMKGRVIGTGVIHETIDSPSYRVIPAQRGKLSGRIDEVVAAITGSGKARERDKYSVDDYRIDEILLEIPEAGYARVFGTSLLTGNQHDLELFSPMSGATPQQRSAWRIGTVRPAMQAEKIGAHAALLSPMAVYDLDDATIVIVWPIREQRGIGALLNDDYEFSVDGARAALCDLASALMHIHSAGYSHGGVNPENCALRPNGRGILNFGLNVTKGVEGQPGDLKALGQLAGVLAQRTGDDVLGAIAADLATGSLEASDVFNRLTGGEVVVITAEQSLADVFTDLEPITPVGDVTVYAATDAGGARVAVKVLSGADSSDPETWREYQHLKNLDSSAVVRTYTAGVVSEGPYMVTELLGGMTLSKLAKQGRELETAEKVSLAMQILSALDAMHPDVSRISGLMATGDPEDEASADELRNAGFVHNDISPENIRWIPGRGAVLFDFDMAGSSGTIIDGFAKPYRPADLPVDVAAPDADLYAVGAVLHELLTGLLPYEFDDAERRIVCIDEKIDSGIREVLEIACASESSRRFRTALEFFDALAASGIEFVDIGGGDDKLERMHRINELVRGGEFDAALELCDDSWTRLRTRIEGLLSVSEGGSPVLLEVDGVELRRGVTDVVNDQNSASTRAHATATAFHYQAVFPTGGYLDFALLVAEDDQGPDIWMAGLVEVDTHPRIKRLAQGLRPGSQLVESDPQRVALRLKMAKLKPEKGPDWSTAQRATESEVTAAAGFDLGTTLFRTGALAYGTHEEAFGDSSKMRGDLCVVFDPTTESGRDVAAIAYFASRVMALWRTIK